MRRCVRIVIVDDHPVVRQGLRWFLKKNNPSLKVVGDAGTCDAAVAAAVSLQPDIVILDLTMPGGGLNALRRITAELPLIRVVIFTASEIHLVESLRHGASAYVVKSADFRELLTAIEHVMDGRRYLSTAFSESAIDAYVGKSDPNSAAARLTAREREVLFLAAEGLTSPEIAERLFISPRTAETHRANLMRKLDLRNQTALIRYALKFGVISV